jgi:hypothetical protein
VILPWLGDGDHSGLPPRRRESTTGPNMVKYIKKQRKRVIRKVSEQLIMDIIRPRSRVIRFEQRLF